MIEGAFPWQKGYVSRRDLIDVLNKCSAERDQLRRDVQMLQRGSDAETLDAMNERDMARARAERAEAALKEIAGLTDPPLVGRILMFPAEVEKWSRQLDRIARQALGEPND
jgi:hypothetical protein